jgi:hypothetical protein
MAKIVPAERRGYGDSLLDFLLRLPLGVTFSAWDRVCRVQGGDRAAARAPRSIPHKLESRRRMRSGIFVLMAGSPLEDWKPKSNVLRFLASL